MAVALEKVIGVAMVDFQNPSFRDPLLVFPWEKETLDTEKGRFMLEYVLAMRVALDERGCTLLEWDQYPGASNQRLLRDIQNLIVEHRRSIRPYVEAVLYEVRIRKREGKPPAARQAHVTADLLQRARSLVEVT